MGICFTIFNMTKLFKYLDDGVKGCWSNIRMDNDDPCWIGIADTGVLVKKSKIGLLGRKIYDKGPIINQYEIAEKLHEKFPKDLTPSDITHPILKAFTNAALHCSSLEELEEELRKFK